MRRARSFALVAALTLAAPAIAAAQSPRRAPAASSVNRIAYDEGFRRGFQAGQEDGRRGVTFNFTVTNDYRRADLGYRSQYGPRDRYRIDFRVGFEAGYRDGYARFRGTTVPRGRARGWGYAGAPGGYGYDGGQFDLALSNGFEDGYEEGLNDGRKRHTNDPMDESRYRDGDRGYERYYGSREMYRTNYRRAFIEGYQAGFRDGWGYR